MPVLLFLHALFWRTLAALCFHSATHTWWAAALCHACSVWVGGHAKSSTLRNFGQKNCKPDWRVQPFMRLQGWGKTRSQYSHYKEQVSNSGRYTNHEQENNSWHLGQSLSEIWNSSFFPPTWSICMFPWDFLPIIAPIWNICSALFKMPQNCNVVSQHRTFVFVWQKFSHCSCAIIKLVRENNGITTASCLSPMTLSINRNFCLLAESLFSTLQGQRQIWYTNLLREKNVNL